ncbi:MAG: dynamin family protein [Spirochaetaceae bacterium]|nr:dynamin family protein [Spirochaetaceae bacterium]
MENIDFEGIFSFISDILNAETEENIHIKNFDSLVSVDFSAFCDSVRDLNQVKDMLEFDKIKNQMRLIANCPPLHSKMVGAVGGGFSSGKSSFINSFMNNDDSVKLAEGIRPVTAIPSYVISGEKPSIQGLSYRGGNFEIKEELYKAISHEMLKKLKFDLKHILSYITVKTNLDSTLFSNICLIDTPGYSAPDSGSTEKDMEIAKAYIKDAKFLIWIVGLDSKGTINTSDLEFLEDLPFGREEGKSLYVVANKAGTVSPSNHQDILDTFRDVLEDYGFEYEGISLYDSKQKKEYLYGKMPIADFLLKQNIPTKKYVDLALPLKEIFDRYENHVKEKNKNDKEYQSKVQKLILDGMTSNAISLTSDAKSKLEDGLYELKRYFKPDDLDSSLKRIGELRKKFFECLDSFCEEMGIEKQELPKTEDLSKQSLVVRPVRYCSKCGNKIKAGDRFCQKCGTKVQGINK